MTPTKGEQTRQRIVELAAPIFNQRGYVGASMRDLVDATGLEKGGIYNHFGSKEQLALEAYDYALSQTEAALARSQREGDAAVERLRRLITAFAAGIRRPVVAGGCPILNTAVEADDTHPELRDRARHSMHLWHRLIGRIVKDGKAAGEIDPDTDPYELASYLTAALEGAQMLAQLFGDPAHADRVVAVLLRHVESLRLPPKEDPQ